MSEEIAEVCWRVTSICALRDKWLFRAEPPRDVAPNVRPFDPFAAYVSPKTDHAVVMHEGVYRVYAGTDVNKTQVLYAVSYAQVFSCGLFIFTTGRTKKAAAQSSTT